LTEIYDDLKQAACKIFTRSFDGIISIILKDDTIKDGTILWIDGTTTPPTISNNAPAEAEPDCIWTASLSTLKRMLDGERALESAFISGRLNIRGDMSIMARLTLEISK